jgi:DNA-directed RNA polymerase subunit RPC12/RpoP
MQVSPAPGVRLGLRAFWMLVVGACLVCATAQAAQAQSQPTSTQIPGATFVGQDTCAQCHEDVVDGFANNPHMKMVDLRGDNGITCENCHGPGSLHVAGGGDITKIFDPAKAKSEQVNQTCLRCHATVHPNLQSSLHAKGGLSCISCHSIHQAKVTKNLLKSP